MTQPLNPNANLSVAELLARQQRRCIAPAEQLAAAERPPEAAPASTLDDLLKSIKAALQYKAPNGHLTLFVPQDNVEVADAVAAAGGEIVITIRVEARAMIQAVAAAGRGTEMDDLPDPALPGFSFAGGEEGKQ